jgi:hypothetical protein
MGTTTVVDAARQAIGAVSAWPAILRPRLRGATEYPAVARPAATGARCRPAVPSASSVSLSATQKE